MLILKYGICMGAIAFFAWFFIFSINLYERMNVYSSVCISKFGVSDVYLRGDCAAFCVDSHIATDKDLENNNKYVGEWC